MASCVKVCAGCPLLSLCTGLQSQKAGAQRPRGVVASSSFWLKLKCKSALIVKLVFKNVGSGNAGFWMGFPFYHLVFKTKMGNSVYMNSTRGNWRPRKCWNCQLWWDCNNINTWQVVSSYFFSKHFQWVTSCISHKSSLSQIVLLYLLRKLMLSWVKCCTVCADHRSKQPSTLIWQEGVDEEQGHETSRILTRDAMCQTGRLNC